MEAGTGLTFQPPRGPGPSIRRHPQVVRPRPRVSLRGRNSKVAEDGFRQQKQLEQGRDLKM